MNLRAFLFVLGGLLTGALPGAVAAPPKSQPQDTQTRIVFPNATVNGRPARLLLDTGSESTLLVDTTARRLGVKIAVSSGKSSIALEDNTRLAVSEPVHVTASGQTFTAPLLLVQMQDALFDGLVGWPEVRDDILVFDGTRHLVNSVPELPAETSGWVKLKIHPAMMLLLETTLPDGTTGEIAVDTGSDSGVVLSQAQWRTWKQAHPNAPISTTAFIMPGAGGMRTEEAWADEVTLGPLTMTNVSVSEASPAESSVVSNYIGTLGMDALGRMDLIVDGKNGFAYLRPKAPPAPSEPKPAREASPTQDWAVDKSVRLKIDRLFAISGAAKSGSGDFTGALADLNRALALNPNDADIYESRAEMMEIQGDFSEALANLDKYIELKPDDSIYPRLYRQLLQMRLGKVPADFKGTVAGWKDGWAKTIGQYLLGDLDEAALLAAAVNTDKEPVDGQKCEAFYYIGMMRLLKGDQPGARDFFNKSVSTGMKDYYEYQFAQAELARMDASERGINK